MKWVGYIHTLQSIISYMYIAGMHVTRILKVD